MNLKELKKESERLGKKIKELNTKRAEIRDMAAKIRAGVSSSPTVSTSAESLTEKLQFLTIVRENLLLQQQISQIEAEIQKESEQLEKEIQEMEAKLGEPLSITIIAPAKKTVWYQGRSVNIEWETTGPVGNRLKIELLKRGNFFRNLSYGDGAFNTGSFNWPIPNVVPPASDYQVRIIDSATGITAESSKFKIQKQKKKARTP